MLISFIIFITIIGGFIIYKLTRKKPINKKISYTPIPYDLESDDLELFSLINDYRENEGFNKLISETLLTNISEEHCQYMIKNLKLSHDNFVDRVRKVMSNIVLENVGYGYKSPVGLFNAYIKSDEHRENILNKDITHIGICTINKYNTCLFAKY